VTPKQNVHSASYYRALSLIELIEHIVNHSDMEALHEFHNNQRVFPGSTVNNVLFAEHVRILVENVSKSGWRAAKNSEVLDIAYDLMIDRFQNIPSDQPKSQSSKKAGDTSRESKNKGTDCRKHFAGFLRRVEKHLPTCHEIGEIEKEALATSLMIQHVKQHFYICVKEGIRSRDPTRSPYRWKLDDGNIRVWFPKSIARSDRRKWLEVLCQ